MRFSLFGIISLLDPSIGLELRLSEDQSLEDHVRQEADDQQSTCAPPLSTTTTATRGKHCSVLRNSALETGPRSVGDSAGPPDDDEWGADDSGAEPSGQYAPPAWAHKSKLAGKLTPRDTLRVTPNVPKSDPSSRDDKYRIHRRATFAGFHHPFDPDLGKPPRGIFILGPFRGLQQVFLLDKPGGERRQLTEAKEPVSSIFSMPWSLRRKLRPSLRSQPLFAYRTDVLRGQEFSLKNHVYVFY